MERLLNPVRILGSRGMRSRLPFLVALAFGCTLIIFWSGVAQGTNLAGTGPDALPGTNLSTDAASPAMPAPTPSPGPTALGQWRTDMQWPLVAVSLAVLHTGQIITWDAWETGGTASVRLWNPSTRLFTRVPTTLSQMFCADLLALADGRLLVAGGHNGSSVGIQTTVIFDPATNNWTQLADMNFARWYPSVTLLPDGRVFVQGGDDATSKHVTIPEIYDPIQNTWTELPGTQLDVGGFYPQTYVTPNGNLFLVRSTDGRSHTLNYLTQTWTTGPTAPIVGGTSTMYRPGKIVTTGGVNSASVSNSAATIDTTQKAPVWQALAPMASPRYMHNLVVLADGSVLAIGGSTVPSQTSTTGTLTNEIWHPQNGTWTTVAPMSDLRMYHSTAALLPDGTVLSAGGGRLPPAIDYQTAQIYQPPYLFLGARPTITSAPATTTYGSTMAIQSPDAASITSAAFIKLGAVTHAFNSDQRYVPLLFTVSGTTLTIQSPATSNIAPPGYYMLFILNGNSVPSIAAIIQISANGGA